MKNVETTIRAYEASTDLETLSAIWFEASRLAHAFIGERRLGEQRILIYVPDGQVTEAGEVTFTKSAAITWPVTLSTYPDADGNSIYIFTDDGVTSA